MEGITLAILGDFVVKFGSTGVLMIGLWAFLTRKIIPEKSHEEALEIERKASEQAARIISTELCEKLSEGVRKGMANGIAEGYLKINGGDV